MSDYIILTDTAADLTLPLLKELDVEVLPFYYELDGQTYPDDPFNPPFESHVFYQRLRDGAVARTAAVNPNDYVERLTPFLEAGQDVLILAFSSGLSSTYSASVVAAEELSEKYPDRKIYSVDTLSPASGQGLLVQYAARKRLAGESIDAVRAWVEENKLHICHWFTVDDLMFLKRGGRLSSTSAFVGTMLGIKPVLHVDNEGHLIPMSKIRGRAAALRELVNRMEQTAIDPGTQLVYIGHGDSLADAQSLADMIRERFGTKDIEIFSICPTIGIHSGPGTIALFFIGTER